MVATIPGNAERKDPCPRRSLRFWLLILLAALAGGCGRQDSLQLGFVGDILPDRGVRTAIRGEGLAGLFRELPSIFGETDLVCANLEAAVATGGDRLVKTFRFNSPPDIGQYLARHRVRAVSLANNHSIDYGTDGLRQTAANLARYGITPFGYGENQRAALTPKILRVKGIRIAFLGAVCFPLEGYAYLPDRFDVARWDTAAMAEGIAEARSRADLVVVSLHWGIEFSPYATAAQLKMAHFCLDRGADLVVGHHPHVLQGVEIYQGKPIIYSLGNFLFDQQYEPARESVFVRASIRGKHLTGVEIIPLYLTGCRPEPARGEVAGRILEKMLAPLEAVGLSEAVVRRGDRAVIRLAR